MLTQKQAEASKRTGSRKLHSIHALPNGREFAGKIEIGKTSFQFAFAPQTAKVADRRLVLSGMVTVKSPNGQKHTLENVEATLLATQGSATFAPPAPRSIAPALRPTNNSPNETEATGDLSSVAVMFLKLAPPEGKAQSLPLNLSNLQLNARLYATSEIERDLQWLYSALIRALFGESPNEQDAYGYLAEINRILKG